MPTPEIIKLLNHGSTPSKFHKSIAQTKMSFINFQLRITHYKEHKIKFQLGELKKTSQKRKCLKEGQHFGKQKFFILLRNKKKKKCLQKSLFFTPLYYLVNYCFHTTHHLTKILWLYNLTNFKTTVLEGSCAPESPGGVY